jgi:outer membrane autotransporter protein
MQNFTSLNQKRLARLVLLALCTSSLTFSWMGKVSADDYEASYAFSESEVNASGALKTWLSQTGAGTQTISGDTVTLSMTAPVISTSGSADASDTFGYSAILANGTDAKFDISGTNGVTITSIGNPVISDDTWKGTTEDTSVKKTSALMARNGGSISVTSSDGDVTVNMADEVPPDDRGGSYNLLVSFSNSDSSMLNSVFVESGSTVSLTGKNVTVSTLGKLQSDGTRYYDTAVQFRNNYGINVSGDGASAEMIATDGNNYITMENAAFYRVNGVAVNGNSSFRAQALNGDNIFTIKPDPTRNMDEFYVVLGSAGSEITIEGINNTFSGEDTAASYIGNSSGGHVLDTYGKAVVTAEKDNNFLLKANSAGSFFGPQASGGSSSSSVYVTAKTGNNTVYLDPSSVASVFEGLTVTSSDGILSLSAPQGENRVVANIDADAAQQTLDTYDLNGPGRISFDGIWVNNDGCLVSLDAQRNIIEIFPYKFESVSYDYYGRGFDITGSNDSTVNLTAQQDNIVRASTYGMSINGDTNQVNLKAVHGDNEVYGGNDGIYLMSSNQDNNVLMDAEEGNNTIYGGDYGVYTERNAEANAIRMYAAQGNNSVTSDGAAIAIEDKSAMTMTADSGDNVVSGKEYGALAMAGGQITIESPQGTNYISSDGTAVDIASGDTAQITISGQSVIEGSDAALKTEYDDSTWWADNSEGGTIQVNYDGSSSITGDVFAMNSGTINIAPQNEGAVTITGNVYGADETIALEDFDDTPAFEYNPYSWDDNIVLNAWASRNTGGTANVNLSAGSRLVGRADTGRRYATALLAKRKATFDEKLEDALQDAHDAFLAYYEDIWGSLTEEDKAALEADWENYAASYRTVYTQESMFPQFEDDAADATGEVNIMLNDGALWDMTGSSSVTTLGGSGGTVYYENGGDALEIGTLSGSHTFAMDLDADDGSNSDMLYINNGTSDEQTLVVKNLQTLDSQMDDGEAVRFATISNSQNEFRNGKTIGIVTNGIYRDALTIEYRDVATDPLNTEAYNNEYNGDTTDGERKPTTAEVTAYYLDGYDDPQNVYLVKSIEAVNDGAVTPERNRDLIWRYVTDMDTFTKRDGQSQYFTDDGKRGGWVRLGYRNLGVDGVGEVDGNTYELGWTTISRQNDERKHRFSASVSYGKPKGQFEGYGGELTVRDFSVNLYDTHEYYPSAEELANKPEWKKKSHAYWDNYLKYHHVKTEYDAYDHVVGTKYSGDYDQDVWNLSTEYGHKLMMNEDWFWVPQAQLQLSYLGGYDYVDSQGLHVDGDHDWSLIGRLGFDLVRDIHDSRDSKLYFKASLMHEFLDGNDVTVRYDSDHYVNEGDQSGTWGVVGLGYSSKIGKEQYFYIDAERYFGNDFDRTYDIRAGINWKF